MTHRVDSVDHWWYLYKNHKRRIRTQTIAKPELGGGENSSLFWSAVTIHTSLPHIHRSTADPNPGGLKGTSEGNEQ
jgi:hypothetical protein